MNLSNLWPSRWGLVGVYYSFTVIQRSLSFLAFIGVVGLTGLVINSAIILIDYIRELSASCLALAEANGRILAGLSGGKI